jgi:MFS family permease
MNSSISIAVSRTLAGGPRPIAIPAHVHVRSMIPPLLRANPDFRLALFGDLASALGTAMSAVAFPLLVLGQSGTALRAGSVTTISLSTRLILRLPAGQLVDRWNRRMVMLYTDLIRMVALATIPICSLWDRPQYAQLVAVAVIEGAAAALFGPAGDILTKDIVAPAQFGEALGLSQSVLAATYLAGPALGGALFALGRELPFAVDSASYAVSALLIWRITARPAVRTLADAPAGGITAGMSWLIRRRALLAVLLYASVINLVSAAIEMLVILELRAMGVASVSIGLILSCSGIGAVVGSVASGAVVRRVGPAGILLGIGAIWTALLLMFAFEFNPVTAAALLALLMTLSPSVGVLVGHTLLSGTPRDLLGRVSAAATVLLSGLAALGPLLAGGLCQLVAPPHAWLVLSALTVGATVLGRPYVRAFRLPSPDVGPEPPAAAPDAGPDDLCPDGAPVHSGVM